jgi:two-component system NtrC family sensor kinase
MENIKKDIITEAEERDQAVADTIEKIAHQWRQPLNTVSLLLQELYFKINLGTLYSGEEDEAKLKELFAEQYNELYDKVNQHLQYLSETVDDFRKAVMFKEGQERKYFSIKKFTEELIEFVETSLEHEKIELIKTNSFENIGYVEVNGVENELKQVLLNLIHNAQDIFRERKIKDKKIFIGATASEKGILLTVRDNAGGVQSDIIDKIFDPYFTTRHETRGTGLGLYMSKEMISKSFDGTIRVENSNSCSECDKLCVNGEIDRGACFIVELPEFRSI